MRRPATQTTASIIYIFFLQPTRRANLNHSQKTHKTVRFSPIINSVQVPYKRPPKKTSFLYLSVSNFHRQFGFLRPQEKTRNLTGEDLSSIFRRWQPPAPVVSSSSPSSSSSLSESLRLFPKASSKPCRRIKSPATATTTTTTTLCTAIVGDSPSRQTTPGTGRPFRRGAGVTWGITWAVTGIGPTRRSLPVTHWRSLGLWRSPETGRTLGFSTLMRLFYRICPIMKPMDLGK